jgi:hypothetical protein
MTTRQHRPPPHQEAPVSRKAIPLASPSPPGLHLPVPRRGRPVTCSKFPGSARTIPGVVAVFEIVSLGTSRVDRIVKVREYAAVPSIRRCVILESTAADLTIFEREGTEMSWRVATQTGDGVLRMPELPIEIPVAELYSAVDFGNGNELDETPVR